MNGTVYIDGGRGVASYVRENIYIEENEPVSHMFITMEWEG